jgi:NADH-quinone oxidoreductase subunit L
MTHAFFKALLFLASGAVILACHHEQDIRKMGGLRKTLPLAFWCFVIGGGALMAFPIITAGFYSKDEILTQAYANGHLGLFYAGLFGAFLTSIYTTRLIVVVFFGAEKTHAHAGHGVSYWLPLTILMVLSTALGGFIHPPLAAVLPAAPEEPSYSLALMCLSGGVAIAGILLGIFLFRGERKLVTALAESGPGKLLVRFWYSAFGFDWLYDHLFVKPFLWLARVNDKDIFDQIVGTIPVVLVSLNKVTALSQSGRLRWYTASVAFGAVLVIGAVVFL